MSSANQLFLLADHIKLSLLERQRARTLHLDEEAAPGSGAQHDSHISRSLDQFRDGIDALQAEAGRLREGGDVSASSDITDSLAPLRKQLDDLTSQFHGFSNPSAAATLTSPNSAALAGDFEHAASGRGHSGGSSGNKAAKTVRFSDTPSSPAVANDADADHEALFGSRYRDDPSAQGDDTAGYRDQAQEMDNQQLHQYHSQILEEQDEQLDRLGESIGRQRELSMQIGDELDSHVAMLDDVDEVVDRHQNRLDRARKALGKVARSAGDNKQMTAIVVLIIILILLIAILK